MTSPAAGFEFEEPQEVEASHLLRCACVACGAETLAAQGQTQKARCARCASRGLEGAVFSGTYTPGRLLTPLRPAERVSDVVPIVSPEMVCPPMCEHTVPAPVAGLKRDAAVAGWITAVRHSRGGVVGGTGKQLAMAELWSVRFRRGPWQGYAVRRGAAWKSVCVAGAGLSPFLALGVTDLKEWLERPDQDQEWYAAIVKRVAQQRLHAKIVKCPGAACQVSGPWTVAGDAPAVVLHEHRGSGAIKIKNTKEREHGG